jgi:hypothetical protein
VGQDIAQLGCEVSIGGFRFHSKEIKNNHSATAKAEVISIRV